MNQKRLSLSDCSLCAFSVGESTDIHGHFADPLWFLFERHNPCLASWTFHRHSRGPTIHTTHGDDATVFLLVLRRRPTDTFCCNAAVHFEFFHQDFTTWIIDRNVKPCSHYIDRHGRLSTCTHNLNMCGLVDRHTLVKRSQFKYPVLM